VRDDPPPSGSARESSWAGHADPDTGPPDPDAPHGGTAAEPSDHLPPTQRPVVAAAFLVTLLATGAAWAMLNRPPAGTRPAFRPPACVSPAALPDGGPPPGPLGIRAPAPATASRSDPGAGATAPPPGHGPPPGDPDGDGSDLCARIAADAAVRAGLSPEERAAARATLDRVSVVLTRLRDCPGSGPTCRTTRSGTRTPAVGGTPRPTVAPPGMPGQPPPGGRPPPGGPPPGGHGMPGPPPGFPPPWDVPAFLAPGTVQPEALRAALLAAGLPDSAARPARRLDPAPAGSLLYAVDVGPACVLGYDLSGGGDRWVVGRLPDGHCLSV
jgi:hypothetical protein